MYTGLTEEICATAWGVVLPMVNEAWGTAITNKRAGTIVVLDPRNGEILFKRRIREYDPAAEKYDTIAVAKARVSRETGLPSRQVQQEAPHLYAPGMTKWGGSVIENKLVVAFSGVQAVFDEAIAASMLAWIIALCREEMTKPNGVMASDSSFIDEPNPQQYPQDTV